MDANKLIVLRDIGYTINPACGTCEWSRFKEGPKGADYSTCARHTYAHLKHGEERELSVYKDGFCADWEPNDAIMMAVIGTPWIEFLDRGLERCKKCGLVEHNTESYCRACGPGA